MAERDVLSSAYIDGHAEGKEHGLKEGLKEGRKEGIKEGRKEGIKEGRKEGIKEGIKEGTMQIARNMKSKGFDVNLISDMTGLTVEVIENL